MHIHSANIAAWHVCMAYTGTAIFCCDVCYVLLSVNVEDVGGNITMLL
jgi:hypothetical protein